MKLQELGLPNFLEKNIEVVIDANNKFIKKNKCSPLICYGLIHKKSQSIYALKDLFNKPAWFAMKFINQMINTMDMDGYISSAEAATVAFEPGQAIQSYQEIINKYGSLNSSPNKKDVFVISVNLNGKKFVGMADMKTISKKKGTREIGEMTWTIETEASAIRGNLFDEEVTA